MYGVTDFACNYNISIGDSESSDEDYGPQLPPHLASRSKYVPLSFLLLMTLMIRQKIFFSRLCTVKSIPVRILRIQMRIRNTGKKL